MYKKKINRIMVTLRKSSCYRLLLSEIFPEFNWSGSSAGDLFHLIDTVNLAESAKSYCPLVADHWLKKAATSEFWQLTKKQVWTKVLPAIFSPQACLCCLAAEIFTIWLKWAVEEVRFKACDEASYELGHPVLLFCPVLPKRTTTGWHCTGKEICLCFARSGQVWVEEARCHTVVWVKWKEIIFSELVVHPDGPLPV